jgi:hypothetical protein
LDQQIQKPIDPDQRQKSRQAHQWWSKQNRERPLLSFGRVAQLIAQLRIPIVPNEVLRLSYIYIEVFSDGLALARR